jgi:hypothetical protein
MQLHIKQSFVASVRSVACILYFCQFSACNFYFSKETTLHVNSGLCIEIRHPMHWLSCSYFGVSFCASMELNLVEAMMCKDAKPTNASL